jgi:beta-glucosidase
MHWGIASASYQTEEPVTDISDPSYFEVDWDLFYKAGRIRTPRGMATYSWSETARDIAAIKSLNVTHYRFGIEWARVEPRPGEFNEEALRAYVDLARRLKAEGITPVVCLWHFNFPSWLTDLKNPERHGWFHPDIDKYWSPYVRKVLAAFADEAIHWMPQNEPNAYAFVGYLLGWFPPGRRADFKNFNRFMESAAKYYNQAADLIHAQSPKHLCITVQNIIYWKKSWLDVDGFFWRQAMNYNFLHLDLVHRKSDIIGFNYYFKLSAFLIPGPRTTDPQGMRYALRELYRRYGKPLWITENGLQEKGDRRRARYILEHVNAALACRKAGVPLEAYFYWSLADNFEWCQGYREKFGLFSMDSRTRQLIAKPSAAFYAKLVARMRETQP